MSKYEHHVSREKIAWYFNISLRSVADHKKNINFLNLYIMFVQTNNLKKQKDYLYSLRKDKVPEIILDYIWTQYIKRLEQERDNPVINSLKKNTRSLL